jgi:cytochrome b
MQAIPSAAGPAASSSAPGAAARAPRGAATRRVTDAPTRLFHALFALSFLGAYLTAEGERWRMLHVTLGYTMVGLLGFRVLYGLFGPRQARMSLLWGKLAGAPAWLKTVAQSRSLAAVPWRQGQNLLMAGAVAALLLLVVPLTLSGYATFDDWGSRLGGGVGDALEDLHEFFGNAFLAVVLAHLGLLLGLSLLRRKNQALPMLTGRIAGTGPDLARRNHGGLAALLLVAVLGFWAWQWQQSPQGLLPVQGAATLAGERGHDDDD